jgi:glutathione S-transferase
MARRLQKDGRASYHSRMPVIYHLVLPTAWQEKPADAFGASSLADEGFIHCSFADQVARSANRFYADASALLVLTIDTTRLTSPLREELASNGQHFPHVYGPINRDAVTAVVPMTRGSDGRWQFGH